MRTMISFQCETQEEAQAVLSAVAAIGKQPHACSKQYIEPKEVFEFGTISEPEKVDEPRKNVSPGAPSIGKIGTSTKEQLLGMLADGHQPPERWCEHMKLLWSREIVGFDGEKYYAL